MLIFKQENFIVMHIYQFANCCSNEPMEMTVAEIRKLNYEILRKASALNKSAFAEKIETDPSYISQIFSDKTDRNMGDDLARKIEKLTGKPRGWMDALHDNNGGILEPSPSYSNAHDTFRLGAYQKVPVVGSAQLGDNGYWCELEYPVGHGDGYINFPTSDPNAYALRCVGESMKPRIRNGEFVVVEPSREAQPGDDVVLKALDGRVMVKTYLYTRDGRVHLISVNELHPPQSFALDEIDKMHPTAGIANKLLWTID